MKKIIFLLIVLSSLPLYAKKKKNDDTSVVIKPVTITLTAEDTESQAAEEQSDEQKEAVPVAADKEDEALFPAQGAESADEPTPSGQMDAADKTADAEDTPPAPAEETPPAADIAIPVASKDEPVPEIEPYKSVYLLDYAELESDDDAVPESAFNQNAGRYQFIENADKKDSEGRTLLMKAARSGNISMLENLLYSEADVNATDNDGWTALMFAARFQKNPRTLELLLHAGARANAENNYGITALLLAAGFSDNTEIVSVLLEKRSIAEKEVLAAFIYAVTNEASADILQLFIDKGIAINAPYEGKTPLMYAAETNTTTATIGWLLDHGARTRYKTTSGQTAYDFARTNKRLPKDKIYWSLNTNGAAR